MFASPSEKTPLFISKQNPRLLRLEDLVAVSQSEWKEQWQWAGLSDGGVSSSGQLCCANEADDSEASNSGEYSHIPDNKMWNNCAY